MLFAIGVAFGFARLVLQRIFGTCSTSTKMALRARGEGKCIASRYVLARVNFTIRCDGHEPKPQEIQAFNRAIPKLIRHL